MIRESGKNRAGANFMQAGIRMFRGCRAGDEQTVRETVDFANAPPVYRARPGHGGVSGGAVKKPDGDLSSPSGFARDFLIMLFPDKGAYFETASRTLPINNRVHDLPLLRSGLAEVDAGRFNALMPHQVGKKSNVISHFQHASAYGNASSLNCYAARSNLETSNRTGAYSAEK